MRFWNIGAEGQILVGGIVTAACMIYLKSMPTGLLLLVMAVSAMAAGAVWGLVPAVFKARYSTHETLFTLMMNYIAIQLTSFFVSLWENPFGSNSVGIINQTTKAGWFPALFGHQYLLNIVIVLALTIGMYVYLRSSKQGYEIAVVGESVNTAKYIGISVKKVVVRTMRSPARSAAWPVHHGLRSRHTISASTAGGRGFTAIIVAWLAKFNTFVMILISLLLVFLENGAMEIASRYNLSDYASQMITGIILFFILGSEFFINYRVPFRKKAHRGEAKA
jgi:simple sugar transport system permease protein